MSSLHLHRVDPVSPSAWFAVAIPATVVSLTVAALAWSLSGNSWIGVAAWLAVAAGVALVADRRGHRNLVAFLGGAAVTLVALSAVPLAVARYYVG